MQAGPVQGAAGPYLAARLASQRNDYAATSHYTAQLIARGVRMPAVMESAIQSEIALGDFDRAEAVAKQMQAAGVRSQSADLVTMTGALAKGQYAKAIADIAATHGDKTLIGGLVTAWSYLGEGKMSEAAAAFDKVTKQPGMKAFALYHKALALASAGDFEGANKIFADESKAGVHMTRRGLIARAEILSQLEHNAEALKLLDARFKPGRDPGIDALRESLKAGETLPFDIVRNPRDGLAEVYLTVASALQGQASDDYTLLYARMAEYLRPNLTGAVLLSARLLQDQKQYDLAAAAYAKVSQDNPMYFAAEMGRAEVLFASGDKAGATDAMRRLAKAYPDILEVQVQLGDFLRRQELYAEALAPYDKAIALTGTPAPGYWGLYYMRGICNERTDHWPRAKADLREALKLNPGEPEVLNYLGYAMVERNENLDEALAMIRKAVAAKPDDGYFVDSLAWALFHLGKYHEALPHMEKASMLMPVDPVVTDHLGDVYWAVGRKLEAEFQWRRALSYGPDKKDAERIRKKLKLGLDAVLKQEGAPPLTVSKNGD